jgi:hypothetical protein
VRSCRKGQDLSVLFLTVREIRTLTTNGCSSSLDVAKKAGLKTGHYTSIAQKTKKGLSPETEALGNYPGGDLRSHTVTRAVSSARRGLTSVFGMGTGVTLAV